MKNLVIVESPTKAKTISKFLPAGFRVESSFGHLRDLPDREMGVDIEHDFKPTYVVSTKGKPHADKLKALAKDADMIWFASDEDREGEAISWHLRELLKPKNYKRITFHEITPKAILAAIEHPRDIDQALVDAQQARRILDRLVGYELSPFLWKKVAKGLSAGRVQSVAVRLIVEREREIEAFKKEEYWTIEAEFIGDGAVIMAKLNSISGKTLKKLQIKNDKDAGKLVELLQKEKYHVAKIENKETKKKVPEPFRTSTLQQESSNKLGFSAKETMKVAQELYEGVSLKTSHGTVGLITYMRTDSLNLSEDFLATCHNFVKQKFGDKYANKIPRRFKTKSKGAQEAHEAIRCTHVELVPSEIKDSLTPKQFKLYNLIWSRTVASQMTEAVIYSTSVDINTADDKYSFRATGQTIKFDGFLKVYQTATKENILPEMKESDPLKLQNLTPAQHFTEPPARYNDASLIKIMEEYGIGRPSTYAPTLTTIQDRNYVVKEDKKFKPTDIGLVVTDLLTEHFPQIVDYEFTAKMEADLDEIADGKHKWQPLIGEFYFPFKKNLQKKDKELTKKGLTEEKTDEKCSKCDSPMVIKMGRFGRFMACSNYPECKNTKPLPSEVAANVAATIAGESVPGTTTNESEEKCEKCGAPLVVKHGRYGQFLGCSKYPDCDYIKKTNHSTGVHCPECQDGDIVSRRGRRGIFYGCSKYPDCKFTLFSKPTGEKCATCGALMVFAPKGAAKCSSKDCATNQKEAAK